jgi:hypothetical protein
MIFVIADFIVRTLYSMYCIESPPLLLIFSLPIMAKRRIYKKTTIARAKAAVSKFRAAKKKASPKTVRKVGRAET